MLLVLQRNEEVVIGYAKDLLECNQLVHANVVDSTFDLRVYAAAHIETAKLKLCSNLLLGHLCGFAQIAYACAECTMIPNTLHSRPSSRLQRMPCNYSLMI